MDPCGLDRLSNEDEQCALGLERTPHRFARHLMQQGYDIEVVQPLLGYAALDHADSYLQPSADKMHAMFAGDL